MHKGSNIVLVRNKSLENQGCKWKSAVLPFHAHNFQSHSLFHNAMAAAVSVRQLQWKQRLAFVRHNLHTASITRDFSFFKCLQAFSLINASDHLSTLTSILGDDDGQADSLILTLDKFNTVIACVHEDAFRNVYDSVRATFSDKPKKEKERQMLYHTEAASQRQMASNSIDKMFNSAVDAIRQHPQASQDSAAHVFITGCTFTAVAMEVALAELENIGQNLNDSSRLDSSWAVVQAAVAQTVSGMKGVFKLMADSDNGTVEEPQQKRHERSGSVDGYAKSMLRRMSTALTAPLYGNSSSASSLTSPTLPSRSSSSTSFISAPSRRDSALSFTTPERSTGVGNASVNWGPSIKRSHSGHTGAMSPIPSTPSATDSNSADDPFDIASANDMAFVK